MNEIEKKIQHAASVHQIKKTSDEIVDSFELKTQRRRQKRFFFIPTATTLLATASALALIFILNPRPFSVEGKTNGFDDGSNVLTSVVSNLSINHYYQPATNQNNRLYALAPEQEEFNIVAHDIDSIYGAYSYYNSHIDGLSYHFETVDFRYSNVKYPYQLSVNNTIIHLKDNISQIKKSGTYDGVICMDDTFYPCEIVSSLISNYVATTFNYRVDDCIYSISKQTLYNTTTINYFTTIDEEVFQVRNVSLKYANGKFDASFLNDDKVLGVKTNRSFSYLDNANSINVNYLKHTSEKDITYNGIKLTIDTKTRFNKHVYSYEDLENVVI